MSSQRAEPLSVRARNALAALLGEVLSGALSGDELLAAAAVVRLAPGTALDDAGEIEIGAQVRGVLTRCGVLAIDVREGHGASPRDAIRRAVAFEAELGRRLARYAALIRRAPIGVSPSIRIEQAELLFGAALFFEAHEVLEAAWKVESGDERRALQGLIQAAAAWEHWQSGRRAAAPRLLAKAAANLAACGEAGGHVVHAVRSAIGDWQSWLDSALVGAEDPPPLPFAENFAR